MGTMWRVRYAEVPAIATKTVLAAIERRLADLVDQLSHWQPGSALCRFNRAPADRWVDLPDDLARVVDAALRLAHATDGAFDPAIGALVDLWGHGPPGPMPVPSDAAIAAARARSGYRRLRWDIGRRRLLQPGGIALDLSGIAKGYAVDALADLLAGMGIGHTLVEIGGELVGRGLRPDGDPWWVEVETPPGMILPPTRVALHQLAIATSGSYRKGEHTLDPRTGRPPRNDVISATVIAPSAMLADAVASAATVLFPNLDTLDRLDIAARIVTARDGRITETGTPRWTACRCD